MGDPRHLRPDEVEIVIARELRKAGVQLASLRVIARAPASPNDDTGYVVELAGSVSGAERTDRTVLVELRNEVRLADADAVRAFEARKPPGSDADGPRRLQPVPARPRPEVSDRPLRVLVSATGFAPAAAAEAKATGIVLLRIADGRAAFLRSQWAMGDQPPAWVPEYMAELADLGPAGDVRYQLITGRVSALSAAD